MDRGVCMLSSIGSQRAGHDWAHTHRHVTMLKMSVSSMDGINPTWIKYLYWIKWWIHGGGGIWISLAKMIKLGSLEWIVGRHFWQNKCHLLMDGLYK